MLTDVQWIKKDPICWHTFAYVNHLFHVRTMWYLYGDIHWCLFYPVASFEHVQNFPMDTTDKSYTVFIFFIRYPSVLLRYPSVLFGIYASL